MQAQLDGVRALRATDPLNSFRAVMEFSEPRCPASGVTTTTEDAGSTYYFDGLCSTDTITFKGPALLHTWDVDRVEPVAAMSVTSGLPTNVLWSGYGFNGQTDVYGVNGDPDFNCSCTMIDIVGSDSDGAAWFFGITQGPAHYTGPEGQGSWMDDPGIDPALSITVTDDGRLRRFQIFSTTSGLGERYDAAELSVVGAAGRGGGNWNCAPDALTLDIDYRDSQDATWSSISLTTYDSSCELCGTASNGEAVCLDPRAALLDWDGSPWL